MGESPQGLFSSAAPDAGRGRVQRAVTLSAGTHAAAMVVLALMAARTGFAPVTSSSATVPLVWTTAAGGPAGGLGGGGDENPTAPSAATAARDPEVAASVASPPPPSTEAGRVDVPDTRVLPTIAASAPGLGSVASLLSPIAVGVPESPGPGRGPGAGENPGRGYGPGGDQGIGPSSGPGIGDGPGGRGGITPAFPVRQVRPQYTNDAVAAKIQGAVTLEVMVLPDGSVGEVRIVRSLDPTFGLDRKAVETVRQWKFSPGRRDGKPIPMLVLVEMTFTLR